jgi:hypothetical protein
MGVLVSDDRERRPDGFEQGLSAAGLGLAQEAYTVEPTSYLAFSRKFGFPVCVDVASGNLCPRQLCDRRFLAGLIATSVAGICALGNPISASSITGTHERLTMAVRPRPWVAPPAVGSQGSPVEDLDVLNEPAVRRAHTEEATEFSDES